MGEEIIGGGGGGALVRRRGLGGRGPKEAADAGGDDAGVHAEERCVEGDDPEESVTISTSAVEDESDLSCQEASHRMAQQHDIRGVAFKRRQPVGQSAKSPTIFGDRRRIQTILKRPGQRRGGNAAS